MFLLTKLLNNGSLKSSSTNMVRYNHTKRINCFIVNLIFLRCYELNLILREWAFSKAKQILKFSLPDLQELLGVLNIKIGRSYLTLD
jgi:hypothetical protein